MILLWICSEICLEMGISLAVNIGQIISRKHRLGADNKLYRKEYVCLDSIKREQIGSD